MEEMVRVSVIAVLGVLVAIQFKGTKPEYATYIGLALGLLVFGVKELLKAGANLGLLTRLMTLSPNFLT